MIYNNQALTGADMHRGGFYGPLTNIGPGRIQLPVPNTSLVHQKVDFALKSFIPGGLEADSVRPFGVNYLPPLS